MVKILELLKGLFSQEKEPEQEKVSISELEDWFNNKIEKMLNDVEKLKDKLRESNGNN